MEQPSKPGAVKFHDNLLLFVPLFAHRKKIEKKLKKNEHSGKNCCSIALRETAVLCVFATANNLRKRLAQ
jgi:hypothetical protein